ncbi:MAG: rhodanese-like domain-containing protein [Verrucomicrobiota bacterium]
MHIFRQFIVIALLSAIGSAYSLVTGLALLPWAEPEIGPNEIRLEDAKALDVIWVDARSAEDFSVEHAPEAIFFDQADPGSSMAGILELWLESPRVIIVYCADAGCGTSKKIAEELRANLPDAEIYSLKGGWDAWSR